MTRKGPFALGVADGPDPHYHAASADAGIPQRNTQLGQLECGPAGLSSDRIENPSLSSHVAVVAYHDSHDPYCASPSGGGSNSTFSPTEIPFTPTSTEAELPPEYPIATSHASLFPVWVNPFLSPRMSVMDPKFNVNSLPPFRDPMIALGVQAYDVLKIKNVPYAVTIPEIKSFVGRLTSSPLILNHEQGYPVHIIMERSTAKTMDCFVEFQGHHAAKVAAQKAEKSMFDGKPLKMGSRHIELEVSNEGELCAALFPRAKSVVWDDTTGVPQVVENQDPFSEGFQGFFTIEEISNVCKHAANPQKSTFSQRCPQRVYESMISTLYKFPWHVPEYYTVNARNFLWSAYMEMLQLLVSKVNPSILSLTSFGPPGGREVGLGHSLLMEFLCAGLNVQMFSLRQKFMISRAAGNLGLGFPLPSQAMAWPFQALTPDTTVPTGVIDGWLLLLDVGFQKMALQNIRHEWDQWIRVRRDESSGFLNFELSDAGRALTFEKLISYELGLMEFVVERGRSEYCDANDVLYEPLNMFENFYPNTTEIEHRASILEEADKLDHLSMVASQGSTSRTSVDTMTMLHSESRNSNIMEGHGNGSIRNATAARSSVPKQFNPNMPSFVPSQPWADMKDSEDNGLASSAAGLGQSRGDVPHLSSFLNPSWAVPHSSFTEHAGRNLQDNFPNKMSEAGSYNREPPSPRGVFASHEQAVPAEPRHSTASAPNRSFDSLMRSFSTTGMHSSSGRSERATSVSALPTRPVFGSIWGSDIHSGSPISTTPHRSASTESSRNASPARVSERNSSVTGPVISQSRSPYESRSAASPGHIFGSPIRNTRSRPSVGHKSFQVHATIQEEGDGIGNDVGDSMDDTANDAGGVNL